MSTEKPVAFTFPGKMGDALMQWPVAYQWSKKTGRKFDVVMDQKSCEPLVDLLVRQSCVSRVELREGIEHWQCGGQPWDFGLKTEDHLEREYIHLGMREFPQRQITLQTLLWANLELDTVALSQEPSINPGPFVTENRCVLHGTFSSHASGVPGFWRFLADNKNWFLDTFEDVCFTGTPEEIERACEVHPEFKAGPSDMIETAKAMAGSRLVVGSGSSNVVLAGCLKVPCVRVHDPIGNVPKVIWSNLGGNQLNETEVALRSVWKAFREEHVATLVA